MKSRRFLQSPEFSYPDSFDPTPAFPVPLGSDQEVSSRLYPEYVYQTDDNAADDETNANSQPDQE